MVLMIALFLGTTRWSPLHAQFFWCWVAMFIAGSVGVWNVWSYLAAIARRVPDERVVQSCLQMRWICMIVSLLLFTNAGILWPLTAWMGIRTRLGAITANVILEWAMLFGRGAFLVVAFFGVLLLVRCRRILGGPGSRRAVV
jgi:hypothetical protein